MVCQLMIVCFKALLIIIKLVLKDQGCVKLMCKLESS